ncbi:hypothetical protein ANO14919_104680 [Xylariales sp. No.14919]|nr:hypothetical protein ANO14919_104680 [Xylariales sp. No.14919]
MGLNILEELSIKNWLETRKEAIRSLKDAWLANEPKRWLEERRAFPSYTSSNPHSCKHCRDIIINLEDKEPKKIRLPYGLPESVQASREGCALYQILVDYAFRCTKEEAKAAWRGEADLSYWIKYSPEYLPSDSAQLLFTIVAHLRDGTELVLDGVSGLTVWTLEGDPASVNVSTRPYELDYRSSTSIAWGGSCIEYCQLNHSICRDSLEGEETKAITSADSVPSRLLRLYRTENNILHAQIIGRDLEHPIPTLEVAHQGFAVLSYCWGGSQPIQLTRETLKLSPSYPTTTLPKTLADAAWFTHQLGLKYLWVDALCILQDDIDDKRREIPRMGQYYGGATVTICAASADTCFRGFLTDSPSTEDPLNYLFGPVELRAKTTKGELGKIQVFKEADYFNGHREREPIVARGWTLQESLLSRRLLIFSSHHLYFSCRDSNASCGGREPIPKSRIIGVYESRVPGVSTISSLQRMYPAINTWDKVVNEYTQRSLGCFDDKLPAISAMAASLVRTARDERQQKLQYYAGLMLDLEGAEKGWKGEFLWAVTQPALPLVELDHPSYPSWSWASLQAPVHRWTGTADDSPDEDGIRLLEFDAPLEDSRNPFGAVTGGFIKLMARTQLFYTIDGSKVNMMVTRKQLLWDEINKDSSRSSLVVRPDTLEADDIITRGGAGVLLVELVALKPKNRNSTYPAGLLVHQAREDTSGDMYYRRIGMFEFRFQDVSVSKTRESIALKRAQTLFESSKLREIYIL